MARHVTITGKGGLDVVIVFGEKENMKSVKREMDGSFHVNTLHQTDDGYEYAERTFMYVPSEIETKKEIRKR